MKDYVDYRIGENAHSLFRFPHSKYEWTYELDGIPHVFEEPDGSGVCYNVRTVNINGEYVEAPYALLAIDIRCGVGDWELVGFKKLDKEDTDA